MDIGTTDEGLQFKNTLILLPLEKGGGSARSKADGGID